jgi:hypothetical protein
MCFMAWRQYFKIQNVLCPCYCQNEWNFTQTCLKYKLKSVFDHQTIFSVINHMFHFLNDGNRKSIDKLRQCVITGSISVPIVWNSRAFCILSEATRSKKYQSNKETSDNYNHCHECAQKPRNRTKFIFLIKC